MKRKIALIEKWTSLQVKEIFRVHIEDFTEEDVEEVKEEVVAEGDVKEVAEGENMNIRYPCTVCSSRETTHSCIPCYKVDGKERRFL